MTNIEQFLQMVKESDNIVFFGGAGVSTESGIPDFRSVDGLYNQKYDYPPETILSHSFYIKYPEEFYRFYRDKMLCLDAEPNITHKKLAELEAAGKVKAVVTQNIDGLHQLAGSKRVLELHGSVHRNYCRKCGKGFDAEYVRDYPGKVPLCDACGGTIKPDVVLYEEGLDQQTLERLMRTLRRYNLARPVGRLSGLDSRIEVFPTVLLALPDADLADAAAESARTRTELGLYERPEGADIVAGEAEA